MSRFLLLFVLGCVVCTAAHAQYVPSNDGVNDWETVDPEEALGWCDEGMDSLYDYLDAQGTKGFIVLQGGRIAVEWYFDSFTQDSLWYWASAGKVVTGSLIGKAAEEGFLDLDDPTLDFLGAGWTGCPENEPDITLRHQLTMTSGLDDGVADLDCTLPSCFDCLDQPGARWSYHNGMYTLLTEVLSAATGMGHNLFLATRINQPIGTSLFYFPSEFNRIIISTPRDMAKFGLLALRQGVWAGDTVLPPAYLTEAMTSSQDLNPSYGHLWWLNGQSGYQVLGTQLVLPGSFFPSAPPDLVAGLGKNDQKLYVIPSLDRVIIRMGNDADQGGWGNSSFDEQLWQRFAALDAALGMCDCIGDLNGDGLQGMPDVLIMLSDFGCNGEGLPCAADLNGDGLTDVTDVLALLSGFGAPCSP
jgi:CubicO group peptidase (beta-lactamase class C family)